MATNDQNIIRFPEEIYEINRDEVEQAKRYIGKRATEQKIYYLDGEGVTYTRGAIDHIKQHLSGKIGIDIVVGALDPYTIKEYPAMIMFPGSSTTQDAQNQTITVECLYANKNANTYDLCDTRDTIIHHLHTLPVSTYIIDTVDTTFYEGTHVGSKISVISVTVTILIEIC